MATLALLLLSASWLPPYLADRAETDAIFALGNGQSALALSKAQRAASLDPLAVGPLLAEAKALQQQGRSGAASATLREAANLQPDNYVVWHDLGVFESTVLGRKTAARASLTRALGLNPFDASTQYELKLVSGD